MTKEIRSPNQKEETNLGHSELVIRHSFVIRHSSFVIGLTFIVVWLSAAVAALAASPRTPRFAVDPAWTSEQGLAGNSVFSLLQPRDGYLWAGTAYGLARFDGIHFEA